MEISTKESSIRNRLIEYYNALSKSNMVDNSSEAIDTFQELIQFCYDNNNISSAVLEEMLGKDSILQETCQNLIHLISLYLFHSEICDAKIYTNENSSNVHYTKNYTNAMKFEMDALRDLDVHFVKNISSDNENGLLVKKIAFIGSGSIPSSSWIILSEYAPFTDIYNIDMSEEANRIALTATERALPSHLSKRMHFITQDICEKPLPEAVKSVLKECQLIYLALLVGENELMKLQILENLAHVSDEQSDENLEQYFIVRTADGFFQTIFPKISAKRIESLQMSGNKHNNANRQFRFQVKGVYLSPNMPSMASIIVKKN